MKVTFDNLDGLGAVDYTAYLCADGPLKIERGLNAPSECSGMLMVADSILRVPVRRARVIVAGGSTGVMLFTGYIATEPQQIYAGVGSKGLVYRVAFRAISDEWLLDKQGMPSSGGTFGASSGATLAILTERIENGLFTTAGLTSPRPLGVFLPAQLENWSANAGAVAAATYSAYRALDGALTLGFAGVTTHALSDGDGSLQLSSLKLTSVKELANDVTVSGEIEPAAYVTELFEGDGTTAKFQLAEIPFRPKVAGKTSQLLSESFDQGAFNSQVWNVTDPGSHLGLSALGLTMTGGTGLDGQTTVTAIDAIEMGGTLVVEAGSLLLATLSDGIICGLFSGSATRTNCFAGYNVRQSLGSTLVVPFVNGTEVGTAFTAIAGHAYTFRIRLHCVETERVPQIYYAMVDGVIETFGSGLVPASMAIVFEFQDLGLSSNTPATVLYDAIVTSTPASCSFVAVDAVQLYGSMGYCRVTQTGSAWVVSTPPTSATGTRLIGIAGEGVDCEISSTGLVTFFAGRVPVAGELVAVTHRVGSRSIARLANSASIEAESAGGMPGTARWLGKVLRPQARSSVDCESAAQAILSFATSRSAALGGTYAAINPGDVWPGDVLTFTVGGETSSLMVRKVSIVDEMACPEALTYQMEFANDWAEGLGLTLSEAIAADALLPQTPSPGPGNVLGNLQQLQLVSWTDAELQIDAGVTPPAGGGFEVRRRDWDFGPQVDQDFVLRSPTRSFSIPREGPAERYYVRMFDASTVPLYSRFSSAIFTNLPVG